MDPRWFLGLDLSTQSLTGVAIDISQGDIRQFGVHFDASYPHYGTRGGVVIGDDPAHVHADPRMWMEAVDDLFAKLRDSGITASIEALGVSAQQHGSVYLNSDAEPRLANLNGAEPMALQLADIFSRTTSPVWMDSSTHIECLEITEALGGDRRVAQLTGSIATERFAAPQIRRFYVQDPPGYEQTAHIALVSSFITSLLIGGFAPVDGGDGFGANLADIETGRWHPEALAAAAPDLQSRLPRLVTQDEIVGTVSPYLIHRYGFSPQTKVIVGSGDNPCSLVGIGLIGAAEKKGMSLGTSDTCFGYLPVLIRNGRSEGHIFGTADGRYMALLCFKNGSLAREAIKDRFGLSWHDFSEILLHARSGNAGKILLPYFSPEITPLVLKPKIWRFGGLSESDMTGNVCAVAEAQIASMYLHSAWMGRRPETILVTAGGSENRGLLRVISNIFNAEVHALEVKDSAALGAAIRAAHCVLNQEADQLSWADLTERFIRVKPSETMHPDKEAVSVYHGEDGFLSAYAACENHALDRGGSPEERIEQFRNRYV